MTTPWTGSADPRLICGPTTLITHLKSPPLVIGDQDLRGPATGVAHYSAAVTRALNSVGRAFQTIDAGTRGATPQRAGRWARAMRIGSRVAAWSGDKLCAPDIFREAQVYFDIWRRPLGLQCDGPPGIVHWTYPVPLRIEGWQNVYTIHDTIPLDHRDLTPIPIRRYRRLLTKTIELADRIVTVSAAAQADIERHFNPPPGFVVDLGEAVEINGERPKALPVGLVRRGYLLHCGTIEPRKNVVRLIKAWARSGAGMPLVLAGPCGWRSGPIVAQADEAGAIRLDYLPRDALLGLIAEARALLMPSLAEGFGLPVAEAMALGTPVVTSRHGALAETASGAALAVDPTDEVALATAIRRVAMDDILCKRLRQAGLARAPAFSIAAFARRLAAFYNDQGL